MYVYRLTVSELCSSDTGRCETFGICVLKICDGREETVDCVEDVFTERERAQALVGLCNEVRLEPMHLRDVIYDALCF